MFSRGNPNILKVVVDGLRNFNTKYYIEKKITDEEMYNALRYGYLALKSELRMGGMAETLKNEFIRFWRNGGYVGEWWLWHFNKKMDYDITEYDTGHPIELAEKIYLASVHNVPYNRIKRLYNIALTWAMNDFEVDEEGIMKLVQFIQWLSWAGYEYGEEYEKLKEIVRETIEEKYSERSDLKFIVFGDRAELKAFRKYIDKPVVWVSWKDNVR